MNTARRRNDSNMKKYIFCSFSGTWSEYSVLLAQQPAILVLVAIAVEQNSLMTQTWCLKRLLNHNTNFLINKKKNREKTHLLKLPQRRKLPRGFNLKNVFLLKNTFSYIVQ